MKIPKLRENPDGRAFSVWPRTGGKRIYFGPFGERSSELRYHRWCQRLLKSMENGTPITPALPVDDVESMNLVAMSAKYLLWAESYYRNKTPEEGQGEFGNVLGTQKHLLERYADLTGAEFGPLCLVDFQEKLTSLGLSRSTINAHVNRVRRFFRWCQSRELLPKGHAHDLEMVAPLMPGKSDAVESEPVGAVPWAVVTATLPFMPPPLRIAAQVQYFCGMRPREVLRMRPMDIDRTGETWLYRPPAHKNSHRINPLPMTKAIPPIAQRLIRPLLEHAPADGFLFDPRTAIEWKKTLRPRKTKRFPCENRRVEFEKKISSRRALLPHYTVGRYEDEVSAAIRRAEKGGITIPYWTPNQLRHAIATELRQLLGQQAAQVWLGHSHLDTTAIYAEIQESELKRISERLSAHWGI